MTATSNSASRVVFCSAASPCAAALALVLTSRFLPGIGLQLFRMSLGGEVCTSQGQWKWWCSILVALRLTSRPVFSGGGVQHCACCVETDITLFLLSLRLSSCRVVLSGSVALGRALGEFLPPKDSGLGRLQLVVVGMALRLSSCRFGASLDVAAFHPRSWQALSLTSCYASRRCMF